MTRRLESKRWRTGGAAILIGGLALVPAAGRGQVWEAGNVALAAGTNQTNAYWGAEAVSGDFNGDGVADLAVGTPAYDFDATAIDSGRVEIFLGGPSGLSSSPSSSLSGTVAGMRIGAALAAGDFDGDGADELVASAPGADVAGQDEAGRVFVYENLLTLTYWEQGAGIQDAAEPFDHFGEALAVGDFDDDGVDDLAIGVPGENLEDPAPTVLDAGVIQILYGSPTGLSDAGDQRFTQAALGGIQANARFGKVLVAGDFNEDDYFYDLAIGVPERDVAGVANAGQVVVMRGTSSGLLTTDSQVFDQTFFGLVNQTDDHFGWSLAAGDFDRTPACWFPRTCFTDLVIGMPFEDVSGQANAGLIVAARGSASGIQAAGAQVLDQGDLNDFASGPEAGDTFGATVASGWLVSAGLNGRTQGGAADHLVVGANNEDWISVVDAGIVHLVFGGPSGLQSETGQYRMIEAGLAAAPQQANARFGSALAIGDFDATGHADLAVGIPEQNVGGVTDAGLVQVLYGALFASGFESGAPTYWTSVVP